jgi:DNA-binding LacI/PurR family transcriptional regulator
MRADRVRKRGEGQAVTIRQVAHRAGVSTATVSRALSGGGPVSQAAAERVRSAARTLGYEPNRIARSLRVRRTRLAAVLIPDVQNPFFTAVVRGVEDVLQAEGWTLLLGNSDDHADRESRNLATLRAEGAAGVVLVPGQEASAYRSLLGRGLVLVAIDRSPEGLDVDRVTVANVEGARRAVAHLLALGHRRVGLVGGPRGPSTSADRRRGYEAALAAAGVRRLATLVEEGDFRPQGGRAAVERLLSREPQPTALFVTNDLMTLGAYEALRARGLRVPQDVAVVGFDDAPWAPWLDPPLTTVAQPAYELGRRAAELLLDRLERPARPPRSVVLEARLVVRESCGARPGRGEV